METLKRLQTQIKTKRKAANISQADIARRLGIARNTYGQYETGARTIRVEHLPELAKLFGCTIDDLFANSHAAKRGNMTLEKAIKMLTAEYERATANPWVRNPLAYALYQVWKVADREQPKEEE